MSSNQQFLGAWSLQSWTFSQAEKPIRHPFGEQPKGHIIYTEQGVMSATLMKQDRPLLESSRSTMYPKIATAIKQMHADNTYTPFSIAFLMSAFQYLNYSGHFSVSESTVTHHVEAALIPDWVGTDLVRSYRFDGDTLVLSAEENGVLDELIWQRV